MRKKFTLTILVLCCVWNGVFGQFISAGTGSWNTTGTWVSGIPNNTADIIIKTGHVVTMNASLTTTHKITIEVGGALILDNISYALNATNIDVAGELELKNTLTGSTVRFTCANLHILNGGVFNNSVGDFRTVSVTNFVIDNDGVYLHNAASSSTGTTANFPGTTWNFAANSRVEVLRWGNNSGGNNSLPNGGTNGYGNLIISLPLTGDWNWRGGVTKVQGNLEILSTGTKVLVFTNANFTIDIGGNLIVDDSKLTSNSGNITNNINIDGDIQIINDSEFTYVASASSNTNLTVNGSLIVNNSKLLKPNTGNFKLDVLGDFLVEDNSTLHFSATSTKSGGYYTVNIGGDFKIDNNCTLVNGSTSSSSGTKTNIYFISGSKANVIFDPLPDFELFNTNIYVENGKKVTLKQNLNSKHNSTSNPSEIKISGTIDLGLNTIKRSVPTAYTSIVLDPGATLITAHSNGLFNDLNNSTSAAITLNAARTTFSNRANYIFTGTANQVTSTSLPSPLNGNLVISNSGAVNANRVQLSKAVEIADTGHLIMENGLLDKNGFSIYVSNSAVNAVQGGNSHSFVMHELRRATSPSTAGQYSCWKISWNNRILQPCICVN